MVFAVMHGGTNDWRHPCEEAGTERCDWGMYSTRRR
jgi:hypothetical protein